MTALTRRREGTEFLGVAMVGMCCAVLALIYFSGWRSDMADYLFAFCLFIMAVSAR